MACTIVVARRGQQRQQIRAQARLAKPPWTFPAEGEAAELMQQGEGLLDDVAQLAQAFDAGLAAVDRRRTRSGTPVDPVRRVQLRQQQLAQLVEL